MAFVFFFIGGSGTALALALTHERVPQDPPLPDVILDNITYQHWGMPVCNAIIVTMCAVTVTLMILHQHRYKM